MMMMMISLPLPLLYKTPNTPSPPTATSSEQPARSSSHRHGDIPAAKKEGYRART